MIFGTHYTELICNTTVIDLPTSPTYCCCSFLDHSVYCCFVSCFSWDSVRCEIVASLSGTDACLLVSVNERVQYVLGGTSSQQENHKTEPVSSCLISVWCLESWFLDVWVLRQQIYLTKLKLQDEFSLHVSLTTVFFRRYMRAPARHTYLVSTTKSSLMRRSSRLIPPSHDEHELSDWCCLSGKVKLTGDDWRYSWMESLLYVTARSPLLLGIGFHQHSISSIESLIDVSWPVNGHEGYEVSKSLTAWTVRQGWEGWPHGPRWKSRVLTAALALPTSQDVAYLHWNWRN